ncbi:MAG: hypothetical protein RLZZ324_303, partial [Candidatus Parcubacteria bacterium]
MLRIVFFGTADFAVPALTALLDAPEHFDVVAVVSQADKPAGRKGELEASPVAWRARARGARLLQPLSLKDETFFEELSSFKADVFITASYGKIIPQRILDLPRIAPLNLHGSLLPKYRGASPIQAAILAGEPVTGASLMVMDAQVDHGGVIARAECAIAPDDTHDSLEKKLGDVAAALLIDHLEEFADGDEKAVEQAHEEATFTSLLEKTDGLTDFRAMSAARIERMSRAYSPWPGAYFMWTRAGVPMRVKILRGAVTATPADTAPGTGFKAQSGHMAVATTEGSLELLEVQPEGKKAMDGKAFANGYKDF